MYSTTFVLVESQLHIFIQTFSKQTLPENCTVIKTITILFNFSLSIRITGDSIIESFFKLNKYLQATFTNVLHSVIPCRNQVTYFKIKFF